MTTRPELFLLTVAFDMAGTHGHMYFRDPTSTEHRQVLVSSTDSDARYRWEPAHGDTRDGWEPFLGEARWIIALIRPDTPDERS
ncbi:hypothetical protein [Curtobacterium sp. VKM Ac-1376]|uniref:hypothetical protein n=1 Tax=Curtobacterium sp. VKM Ac-1376 TaxID=123312 RepID=UPI00188D47DD|nr:hypothetical protein [Curtobacterium sp. VKM Ac-1376]MBF4615457.1 hypothetical protein [Curtobacterium sp. VKM Ac-1376]